MLTLWAYDRRVELSTLDSASKNLTMLTGSVAIARHWSGGFFASSGGYKFVAWGRHNWQFDVGAGVPVDFELPTDITTVSDQPGGISGLQVCAGGLLVVAVNGPSEFVTLDTKTSG